jgi:hypothetical protein
VTETQPDAKAEADNETEAGKEAKELKLFVSFIHPT